MNISDDRAQSVKDAAQKKRMLMARAQSMHESDYSNAEIAEALDISENEVRKLVINWGYNCLTAGVHHGRPEAIWNIPLVYAATVVFDRATLQELVISRIYNDAMQYVEYGDTDHSITTPEWVNRVKGRAEELYLNTLTQKVGEITKYYDSSSWQHDQQQAARLVTE